MDPSHCRVAYFSMEIGLAAEIPTYAGGLGILAGDTIRSAADLGIPMAGVTLAHRAGYFDQILSPEGIQAEHPVRWRLEDHLVEESARAAVRIEGREVALRAWRYDVRGVRGAIVPVYLLDSDLPENAHEDRRLTDHLYGGDQRYRLCQEIILGIGGERMLRALGYSGIQRFHLNEGHASLLTYELLSQRVAQHGGEPTNDDVEAVRARCVFTTHTPVPAGPDRFPIELVHRVLGESDLLHFEDIFCCEGVLNMTRAALKLSRFVNAVAKRHADVSRQMFLPYPIESITNGVHAATWTARPFQALFDRYIPLWREDNFSLRAATAIPEAELWEAHQQAKRDLIDFVNRTTRAAMSADIFTIGYARRATAYKRPDMLVSDLDRLRRIATGIAASGASSNGSSGARLQIIYAGKAHPRDTEGKELIRRLYQAADGLRPQVKVVFLANYDMHTAALIVSGVDLWLNTPQPPLEASGTSGMKAALNGVPSLSTLDGWWLEGCLEGVTGWAIGEDTHAHLNGNGRNNRHAGRASIHRAAAVARSSSVGEHPAAEHHAHATGAPHANGGSGNGNGANGNDLASPADTAADAARLYDKLEHVILPLWLHDRTRFIDVMRHAIALNGAYFNTDRMIQEYVVKAYF